MLFCRLVCGLRLLRRRSGSRSKDHFSRFELLHLTPGIESNVRALLEIAYLPGVLWSYRWTESRIAERIGDDIAQRGIGQHLCHFGAGISTAYHEDPLVLEFLGLDQIVENAIRSFAGNTQLPRSAAHANGQHYIARFEASAWQGRDFKRIAGSTYGSNLLAFVDLKLHLQQHLFPFLDQLFLCIVALHREPAVLIELDRCCLNKLAPRVHTNRARSGGLLQSQVVQAVLLCGAAGAYPCRAASDDRDVIDLRLNRPFRNPERIRDKADHFAP